MPLDWKTGGLLLGAVFFAAVLLVKPIGVSTQFVILDGILADAVNADLVVQIDEGYASSNAYLNKSDGKYARSVANPLNYSFVFVLAMALGGFVSARMRGGIKQVDKTVPALWRANFGSGSAKRYAVAFLGGFIVLYGARLAGGCTSGHMMSGMMQTALSGYLFTIGAFAAAIPVALTMYKREA
ncbi:YeeE/YedE thiosulfate transporter family protein [Sedimentitalea nanhaiensis]|uniref:Uncharacterized protein n=1 Tax=Sedimentitalea nanhaiensis TaxID=999627 RepID=A0A1I7D162_9RHOB|nr:YeeE/YedE thiosulfate transporter family protein [Sedimentitalea nanhaiensis]SFU05392.1 hypothetical protein SAMN05216236_12180 [Sedimentitalea nanhaiensis]